MQLNWFENFLFPRWCRKAGYVLLLAGIAAAYLVYILDVKPGFLHVKVFAVFSYYLKRKYLTVVNNNISEEIIMLLMLSGLFLISFSKLKFESPQTIMLRLKALFITAYINTLVLIVAVIFFYGLAFIAFTVANCFFLLLVNSVVFGILLLFRQKDPGLKNKSIEE